MPRSLGAKKSSLSPVRGSTRCTCAALEGAHVEDLVYRIERATFRRGHVERVHVRVRVGAARRGATRRAGRFPAGRRGLF